jgi:RNA 2',3'-cyclic 3'-phosphodiesterase
VRLFVAIEVGSTGEEAPDHLTLAFLGEVDPARRASIAEALTTAAAPHPPFELVLEGVGAFPSSERPRVVWQGVGEGRAAVDRLAGSVRAALVGIGGAPDEGRFHPHVTLFRVRSPRDRERARELLEGRVDPPPPRRVAVQEIVLKSSVLTPRGAIHRTEATAPLRGSPPDPAAQPAEEPDSVTRRRQR